jgi:preprotein translocase subunit SecE
VARDRQRAKQRKARRAQENPGPGRSEPLRENVPGELEHSSGEVDEFEAALVAGAGGEPAADGEAEELPERDLDELGDEPDEGDAATVARPRRERAPEQHGGPLARFLAFLKASWAELQRVQWPDRRQVTQATAVVLGFVIVAGAYLGFADYLAGKIVDFII